MVYILLISASFVWGFNVLVMKDILNIVPMYFLAAFRVGISFLSLWIVMKIKGLHFKGMDYKVAGKVAIFSLAINFAFTFMGMTKLSGTHNALMNALAPLVTIFLFAITLHQKITRKQAIAVAVAILAFAISLDFNYHNLSLGHGLLLLGMISYCYGNVIMQGSRNASNFIPFTAIYLFFGFLALFSISLLVEPRAYLTLQMISVQNWMLFLLFSGIGFAFIQVVYLYSLKTIGGVKTSFFLSLNPVFTYLGAIIFYQESLDLIKLGAFLCMIVALIIANKKET